MAQTEARSIFDLYPNMLKTWTDIFNQWPRTVGGFYPGSFKTAGMENWFIPFWGYMEDWTKAYQGLTNMAKSTAAPYESMKEMNEMVAKGINSYVKIYDAWLRSMDSAAREGYAIGQKLMEGEEVDTGSYFDVMRDAYYNTTSSVMEALKDTPFSGMEDIFQKVKNSIEEFS